MYEPNTPLSPFDGGMCATQNSKLARENRCQIWTEHERIYLSCIQLYFGSVPIVSTGKSVRTLTLL